EDEVLVRIDDGELFLKGRELRNEIARRIYRDRVAIEDKLVIAPDGVAIKNRSPVGAREGTDHFPPNPRFVQTERRRTQVDDDLGAAFDQSAHRFDIVKRAGQIMFRPNIFANGDTDFLFAKIDRFNVPGRFEIAVFIEDIVG